MSDKPTPKRLLDVDIAIELFGESKSETNWQKAADAFGRLLEVHDKMTSAFELLTEMYARKTNGQTSDGEAVERVATAAIALADKVVAAFAGKDA